MCGTLTEMLAYELLTYLFDGQPHPLATLMGTWLSSSRRYMTFVTDFRNKIRKKIRTTQDMETVNDLRFELETAYLLAQERTLSLVYEPQHYGQGRCPDFAVSFTTSLTFMVEVTRIRAIQNRISSEDGQLADTIADTLCSKLGQLLPQHSNIFVVGTDNPPPAQSDLQAAMLRIQQRAERNDPAFWGRHRFRDRADFFRQYYRLSEVLVRRSQLQTGERSIAWVNPQAKYPMPSKVRTALYRSHSIS